MSDTLISAASFIAKLQGAGCGNEGDGIPPPVVNWAPDWSYGAQSGATQELVAANELKSTYSALANGVEAWAVNTAVGALESDTLYVQFQAKMPNLKHGMKFLKIFGKDSAPTNKANCTLGLDYTGNDNGALRVISFGDGTGTDNDTQNVIQLNGGNPSWVGRSYGVTAALSTPIGYFASTSWGTDYHDFKFKVKFNTGTTAGNEVADGEFYLAIDDVIYCDATGLFNRHYSNGNIKSVEFFGYTTNGPAGGFDMTIKNPYMSTVGFE